MTDVTRVDDRAHAEDDPNRLYMLRAARGEIDSDEALEIVRTARYRPDLGHRDPELAAAIAEGDRRFPEDPRRWPDGPPAWEHDIDSDPATNEVLDAIADDDEAAMLGAAYEAGTTSNGSTAGTPDETDNGKAPSVATQLVQLAETTYSFGQSDDGTPYAVEDGRHLVLPLRGSGGLRQSLARAFWQSRGRVASGQALSDALAALEGACLEADRVPVALRIARAADGRVALDLGDADEHVIVIGPDGWSVTDQSPTLFRRSALTGALPMPEHGGSLDDLRQVLPVTDGSWPLVVGWLVAALIPEIAHPVLALRGPQGSGKSTTARMLTELVDPSGAPLRTAPRDVTDWAVTAAGSWVVTLDNISTITEWLSDALCRAVTGDGLVRRELYTDDGISVLSFRRAVILTSIDPGALKGDLAERMVTVELEMIRGDGRRPDHELTAIYEQVRPRTFGALLDLVAQVLKVLPTVQLETLPRMADFARVLAAIDQVTGLRSLAAYLDAGRSMSAEVLDDDPVAAAVRDLARKHADQKPGEWLVLTAADLHERITPDSPPKGWPKTPRGLSGAVRRAVTVLADNGTEVVFPDKREAGTGRRLIWIRADESAQA